MKPWKHTVHFQTLISHPSKSIIPAIPSLFHQHHCSSSSSSSSSVPSSSQSSSSSYTTSSSSSNEKPNPTTLTQQDLTKINLLIPRLCLTDHLNKAIHLTTTALLSTPPPPPASLSLSILAHSLASQPDMSLPMSLLTVLRHHPQSHPHLTPLTTLLLTSYIKRNRRREALKVYHWMLRPGSPCRVGKTVYGVLVPGLCRAGWVLEALRVLRDMLALGFVPVGGLRERVYRSLLMEARVKQAVDLDKALCSCAGDANADSVKNAIALLDSIIEDWSE
ncbi:hypothetical protein Tsubulata_023242 [Turnera subulata]|uniref:Pentatricopeptide repeat-containing protein n=1 Tax=Turnera subulata TaxID=218843 RepID=A0A9Q0FVZ4_9ROSI|nr:hypothetical protein Tsubulata_023242 [Turnera subulata]